MNRKRMSGDDDEFEEGEDNSEEYDDEYSDEDDEANDEDDEESEEEDELDEEEDDDDDSIENDEDEDDGDEEEIVNEYDEDLVFVIMPFRGADSDDIYSAIRDECSKLGLEAQIASMGFGSGSVIQEITNWISQAEFIICDLTSERPNVYYELGHAHGLGNDESRILLIAKEDTSIHFDVASLRIQFYRSTEHLRSILSTNLNWMIQNTRS